MSKQTVYQPPKDVKHKVGPIHQCWPSKYVHNYKAEYKQQKLYLTKPIV